MIKIEKIDKNGVGYISPSATKIGEDAFFSGVNF